MELYREIRAFAVKLPRQKPGDPDRQDLQRELRELSNGLPVSDITVGADGEVVFHAEMDFSLVSWDNAVTFLRSVISFLKLKRGFLFVRKISGDADSLKTEIEAYKVTKRGVYYTEPDGSSWLLEDIMRFSGRNKRLLRTESMGNLLKGENNRENEAGE